MQDPLITKPRFGCRMLATMNAEPETKKKVLITAPRSLKDQSLQPIDFTTIMPDDTFHPVARKALNTDGFGALLLDDKTHHQTYLGIGNDVKLPHLLKRLKNRMSGVFHIRYATVGDVTDVNSHPYTLQDVSLIQNGSLDSPKMNGFLYSSDVVKTIQKHLPDVTLRTMDSDSKRLFYYWLAYLKATYPDTLPAQLPTPVIKDSFKHIQDTVMATRPHGPIALQPDLSLPISGALDFRNKINSIISVGDNRIIGLKHGRELHLGYQTNQKGQMTSAILATEPPKLSDYRWVSIPDKHWITLTKMNDHLIQAELMPYDATSAA
jgi:predicted glutamine amidotransferase